MARKAVKPRIAWEDRFAPPDADDLLDPFPKYQVGFIGQIREGMTGLDGVVESIVWHGVPWRWTFAFASESEPERPWAYLVPQPGRPLLAMPLTGEVIAALPMRKLSKSVRDGLALASRVGGVYWPQWPLVGRAQVEELIGIARRRHEMMGVATA